MRETKINELVKFDKSYDSNIIIGTDEAGRGPAAGPVMAAAVCFTDFSPEILQVLAFLNDSKKLTPKLRSELSVEIKKNCIWAISSCTVEEIEKINILQASLLSMKKACNEVLNQVQSSLEPKILVDGNKLIPKFETNQQFVIKGDGKSASIAAASVLAKVERDEMMIKLAEKFPHYAWEKNKGYLTAKHIEGIQKKGINKWHRKSFLKNYI